MFKQFLLLFCAQFLISAAAFAQIIKVPDGFEGPIFFDISGQNLKNQIGANIYRIYRSVGVEEVNPSNALGSNNQTVALDKIVEKINYYYFEDHYLTGELEFQGHMMIARMHEERGVNLYALKVHLKGECRWFNKNGKMSQTGIFNGEDWYGPQKYFNDEGKLLNEKPGKGLGQYLYNFERGLLRRKGFKYQENVLSDILPAPSVVNKEDKIASAKDTAQSKPIDIQAKIASMPHFPIKNYRPYEGVYQGITQNITLNKKAETSISLSEIDAKNGEATLEIQWVGGFTGYAKVTGSIQDNVIFAQGDMYLKGEKVAAITLVTFLQKENNKIEGFFNAKPIKPGEKVQSYSFVLNK
jgi:hypothetical protein